jgi:transcriptional regulator with XRE-family HTH domain
VTTPEELPFPERVAELRRRRGLSQRELAGTLARSESWVSQVERGVQPVQRFSVLQALADALGVPVRALRPEAAGLIDDVRRHPARNELDQLRLALIGHPALDALLNPRDKHPPKADLTSLRERLTETWALVHASDFRALGRTLSELLPALESAARTATGPRRRATYELLASAYQATAAGFAAAAEPDAAWIAADRAIRCAEDANHPLHVMGGLFRMAHAFIRLDRLDFAQHIAATSIEALQPLAAGKEAQPEVLSLLGSMHVVLATVAARDNDRLSAHTHVAAARTLAERVGHDRDDLGTEFGPTNVELHAITVAVDLGDAGEALATGQTLDVSQLSPERQARFHLDLARAHTQRRQVGDALDQLLTAEQHSAEQVRNHELTRETIRDLLGLSGRRPPDKLTQLAKRSGAIP